MFKIYSVIFCFFLLLSVQGCSFKNYFVANDLFGKAGDSGSRNSASKHSAPTQNEDSVQVVAKPDSISVLVNKQYKLPNGYKPKDLVDPNIPFIFNSSSSKREMRSEAASAIEKLFAGAKDQGVSLLGVSAYRSYASQASLFNYYVHQDGYKAAKAYSALPGTSEHETGLAIDVTGGDGKCAAEDCFAGTTEAKWLQKHAADYGFIIRYPKGKESITGYQYEPWHLRYIGKAIAKKIMKKGITLEEYYSTIPVNK
ncbi:M15 family metallopeptidase [Bacillus sp. BRMEA1]|uniref:M15 family metallopeptidase n=1 Tax=Neobacillus endophyticus TaxID=2738405 RepID=UPI001563F042|nr:M15 family metallopeptidase [Neobacillus endophyticus]NRD76734.1 M15 family metallopeptidase [Neobacillus endophyticus]